MKTRTDFRRAILATVAAMALPFAATAGAQATKPKEAFSSKAVSAAVVAMEREHRASVPFNTTTAQAAAAQKAKEKKLNEILDALREMPVGNLEFVVDDVIHRAPPHPETGIVTDNPILRLNQTLQDRESNKQMNDAIAGEYAIVGHLDWKTSLIKSPDNRPVQKVKIYTSNQAVKNWKVGERHQLPVACDSVLANTYNIKEQYVQAGTAGGGVQLKMVVDNSACYVGLTMTLHEAERP